jgi:hypothetical protein
MRARKDALLVGSLVAAVAGLAIPSLAAAHLERPSYWPDPAPDTSVSPPAGGEVPSPRSLASAVTGKGPGDVNVVCRGTDGKKSLALVGKSLRKAQRRGFRPRPSQPKIVYGERRAQRLFEINEQLADQCEYHFIQEAVDDSGNNDRVVIMPGRYKEKPSRKAPTNDPACDPSLLQQDQSGANTPSYEYQATCPNDQNLVYVQGRAIKGDPLAQPDPNRHGIPEQELGRCIRCNLQIEGSGVKPEDVIIDAGRNYGGEANRPGAQPGVNFKAAECHTDPSPCYTKHVVLRTDRSDGFVGRNFLVRGAREHGFYTEETDGVLLDRVKFFWTADYGHLSFTTDHNVVRNCEGFGGGDATVYPGAAPQTGEFRDESFYPEQRINTVVKKCDLHGSLLAYSGSMGNSVRVTRNHIYGNTNGIASDTLSAAGHPGFPNDSMEIDHNYIYSNNLNLYTEDPPFEPLVGVPIGSGLIWAGENQGQYHDNWVFDNWRQGAMLLAVPDALAGDPEGNVDPDIACATAGISSTSCANEFYDNHMGQVPPGFKFPSMKTLTKFGNVTGVGDGADVLPNGLDFWWDEFPGNTENCWYDNVGPDGTRASVTGDPALAPTPGVSLPNFLPEDCATSVGNGDPVKEAVLLDCAMYSRGDTAEDHPLCFFFQMPAQPGSPKAARQERRFQRAAEAYAKSDEARALSERLDEIAGRTAFADRP